MKRVKIYTLDPHGLKGGRNYLRMINEIIPDSWLLVNIPD
jgi:hypothetical protein